MKMTRVRYMIWLLLCLFLPGNMTNDDLRDYAHSDYMVTNLIVGKTTHIAKDFLNELNEESKIWHKTPWLRTRISIQNNVLVRANCSSTTSSLESYPDSIFNRQQLLYGGFLMYLLFGFYSFSLLATVCNDYFVPAVETSCEILNVPKDIAAATFMAVATSFPEFSINMISTFISESDMGIGTIIGSAYFNCLFVSAIGGLASINVVKINSGPITRDVVIYMMTVLYLVIVIWDGVVTLIESIGFLILYILYFLFMFNSMRILNIFNNVTTKCCYKKKFYVSENKEWTKSNKLATIVIEDNYWFKEERISKSIFIESTVSKTVKGPCDDPNNKENVSMWKYPSKESIWQRLSWLYIFPIKVVLFYTIPDPIKYKRLFFITFLMCILWLGINSYVVSWAMTVIGDLFGIPDSVMGMTILASGGCLPEACAIYILSRQGNGEIGVSNALGANSLAILFAFGTPYLIKCVYLAAIGSVASVAINSSGIDIIFAALFVAIACLWLTLFFSKFLLNKRVGIILVILYTIFITFAVCIELGLIVDISKSC